MDLTKKQIVSLGLEIPALETSKEGKLMGGFEIISGHSSLTPSPDGVINLLNCTNCKNCINCKSCNNDSCSTPSPTPTPGQTSEIVVPFSPGNSFLF